ncbi:condensation domain-containing protein, partial [Cupriavidus respiraculi]
MSVDKLRLAQRFAGLKPEAQQRFIEELRTRGMDFGHLPIPARGQTEAALSYAQQRLWFLWQMDPDAGLYNIPRAVRLRGTLNDTALRQTFDALVARHESLRTTFHQEGEAAVQRIHAPAPFTIAVSDLTATDPAARDSLVQSLVDTEAQAPFDLERGPLLRVRLLRLADDDHILLVTMHHIISDGWSMNV